MIGERLEQYEILEKIGQGGMGEVWRARDVALEREVAVKLLPEYLSSEGERLERFEREARLLASLDHPGIATVYGLHETEGRHFLAMELVPGEDLAGRLERGPLEIREALSVGAQVARALEAAHGQGVIHRDLKPANVMLTPDGRAKVLDFGLAKIAEPAAAADLSHSPTLTARATAAGTILGTAAYMSPEQARGREVDRRTDVWSFGCVLYECLTGHALYRGESVSDSLGAVLHKEPDWSRLPEKTPPTVHLLLRRCLAKDPDRRLHDIADARIELEQAAADPEGSSMVFATSALEAAEAGAGRRPVRRWLIPLLVGVLALGLVAGWLGRGTTSEAPVRKLDLGLRIPGGDTVEPALSPDGGHVAFVHRNRLWVQTLDALEPRPLEGTEGAVAPFWSPDGSEIGYFVDRRLWRIPVVGGSPVAVGDVGGELVGGRGASWGEDGRIVFSRGGSGLLAIPALGGTASELLSLEEGDGDFHEPHLLPEGRGILFVAHPEERVPAVLEVVHDGERRILFDDQTGRLATPVYAPSGQILLSRRDGPATDGLWALPFSLDDLALTGEPFLVAPDAVSGSVSRDGSLVFQRLSASAGLDRFVWTDRSGRILESIGAARVGGWWPALSPDGRRLAFWIGGTGFEDSDLWVRDLERGTETRLTLDEPEEGGFGASWLDSGREILYTSVFRQEEGGVSVRLVPADGSRPPRALREGIAAEEVTPDGGSFLAIVPAEGEALGPSGDADVALVPLEGAEPPRIVVGTPARETSSSVSPDGRWLAYELERGDTGHVFLTRFPEGTGRWQVSVEEGSFPQWDPRGDRLYFMEGRTVMQVMVGGEEEPRLGTPEPLFEYPRETFRGLDLSPDGQRFVLVAAVEEESPGLDRSGIKVVQSWAREFRP